MRIKWIYIESYEEIFLGREHRYTGAGFKICLNKTQIFMRLPFKKFP
jgi:hypothetical protein